jgi:hypothetical protein
VHAGNLLGTGHCCAKRAYYAIDRTQCDTIKYVCFSSTFSDTLVKMQRSVL